MKQDILEAVNGSILDICVHPLVEDGTFDVQNTDHMFLLMESLIEKNFDDTTVAEVVKALRHEGKHPERQAYNKDGWLVTFPSKEYRDAALKKRTHAIADPTHGNGGMNLYYKKKGKQKRVTRQATSQTDPTAIEKQAPAGGSQASTPDPTSSDLPSATEPTTAAASAPEKTAPAAPASSEPSVEDPASAQSAPTAVSATEPAIKGADAPQGAAKAAPAPQAAPKEPVVQPKVDITVQFAKSKNWSSTPYGEWRDSSGSVVAVVSLSGEVAPIKSNDRDELKLFADKQG